MSPRFKLSTAVALAAVWLLGCAQFQDTNSASPHASLLRSTAEVQIATSKRGIVVAGHPEAAELGIQVLQRGGSAMDAAVAVSFGLAVAEPYGSGLGGKMMMLYSDAATGEVVAIDAMDQASSSLDPARFASRQREERIEGWAAVAVPGLVAGMYEGHRRWGRLEWRDVVQTAADLARRGSLVLPGTRELFERRIDRIRVSESASEIFLPDGRLPDIHQRLANPDLAKTLSTVADEGAAGFYDGWVAEAIAAASQRGGGSLTLEDLSAYAARVVEPLSLGYEGLKVVSAPPPATGGATVLAALARLAEAPWHGDALLDAENLSQIGRILQRLYPEIQARIADVPSARRSFDELVAQAREPSGSAAPPSVLGAFSQMGMITEEKHASTTHFVVVDAEGSVASVTQSLSHHFGAGVVAPGTGVIFNNSMKNFTIGNASSVNSPAPAKRPRSTIAPTLVFKHGRPILAIGIPGGQRIPTATLQVLLDVITFDTRVAEAITKPRVHFRRPLRKLEPSNLVELEAPDRSLEAALVEEKGWLVRVNEDSEAFGGFCAAEIRPDGSLIGIADLRRTNAARGLPDLQK